MIFIARIFCFSFLYRYYEAQSYLTNEFFMKQISSIADPILESIEVAECGDPLVNVKSLGTLAYGPPPDTPLTKGDYTFMRQGVYERLLKAQTLLPGGWRFRLYEGYRSIQVQTLLFDDHFAELKYAHPDATDQWLFDETARLVSPVKFLDGHANIPPHNTGAAVDVELLDEAGELVDMGMACKDWLIVDPNLCNSETPMINELQRANRAILFRVMREVGFVNYFREWWHFSYGDRLWAYLLDKPNALYGPTSH